MIELVSAILRLVYTFPTSLGLSLIAKWLASKHIYTDRFPPTAPSASITNKALVTVFTCFYAIFEFLTLFAKHQFSF